LASKPGEEIFHFNFMLYGWLLDENSHWCESLADLCYPVVLLHGRKSCRNRFIERFCGDLYGVLYVSNIPYRNCAGSENHIKQRSIFVFCSPLNSRSIFATSAEALKDAHRSFVDLHRFRVTAQTKFAASH
jgi:hypothetical protein